MNDELAERHADAIQETLGHPGRMISGSKSGYRSEHPDHVAVFNASVCLKEGEIWEGDFDLTLDEDKLVELAARIGETVYLLYEGDGRASREQQTPRLELAAYSVTPSGHTRFDHRYLERRPDGTLRKRPPDPATRKRLVLSFGRPRLLRFWEIERKRRRYPAARGGVERTTLIYIGRGANSRGIPRSAPLLILGHFHRDGPEIWHGLELTWYPTPKHHAPIPLTQLYLARRRGRIRPYLRLLIHPGVDYGILAGIDRPPWR